MLQLSHRSRTMPGTKTIFAKSQSEQEGRPHGKKCDCWWARKWIGSDLPGTGKSSCKEQKGTLFQGRKASASSPPSPSSVLRYKKYRKEVTAWSICRALHCRRQARKIIFSCAKAKKTCYDSKYPFLLFKDRELPEFYFDDITIFYGDNGSGKSTLLNVIAEKLELKRSAPYNATDW